MHVAWPIKITSEEHCERTQEVTNETRTAFKAQLASLPFVKVSIHDSAAIKKLGFHLASLWSKVSGVKVTHENVHEKNNVSTVKRGGVKLDVKQKHLSVE